MSNASASFLLFAAVVIVLANLSRRVAWRQAVLVLASAVFLWACCLGTSMLPLLGFVALGYASLKLIESGRRRWLAPLIVATVLVYIWLKQYTFLPPGWFLRHPYATIGLSYILFRVIHLLVDASAEMLPVRVGILSYLAYTLNFTTLVAGPIQRYQDFHKSWVRLSGLSVTLVGVALERIVTGFFKTMIAATVFSTIQNIALGEIATAPGVPSKALAGAVTVAAYPFFLYCNFSGYIDIVIGVARLVHIELPENFDRPFSADSFIGFWSRWHITLSEWLKTYVYNPLLMGLMRRFPAEAMAAVWGVAAYFVTFFLIGVWHGRTPSFLFFGVLQGLGVSVNKAYELLLRGLLGRKRAKALASSVVYMALSRGLTFTWFTFTLLWFWSDWARIDALANSMGGPALFGCFGLIFAAATLALSLWEALRAVLAGHRLEQRRAAIALPAHRLVHRHGPHHHRRGTPAPPGSSGSRLQGFLTSPLSFRPDPVVLNRRHADDSAHLKQPRSRSHPNAVFEEILAVDVAVEPRAAPVPHLWIAQIRRGDQRLALVAPMRDHRRHHVLHELLHAMRAQVVQQQICPCPAPCGMPRGRWSSTSRQIPTVCGPAGSDNRRTRPRSPSRSALAAPPPRDASCPCPDCR